MRPVGAEARDFRPIGEENFQDYEYLDRVKALKNEGWKRLSELQRGREDIAQVMAEAFPEGLDWEKWRRSENVEYDVSLFKDDEAASLGISPSQGVSDAPILHALMPKKDPRKKKKK
jgi:hypothetical protein